MKVLLSLMPECFLSLQVLAALGKAFLSQVDFVAKTTDNVKDPKHVFANAVLHEAMTTATAKGRVFKIKRFLMGRS